MDWQKVAFDRLSDVMGGDNSNWDLFTLVMCASVRLERLLEENEKMKNGMFTCPDCGYNITGKEYYKENRIVYDEDLEKFRTDI
jgi:hypothetical protein